MNVFITGAGLVGAHTAALLAERGHLVTLYDAAPNANYVHSVLGTREVRLEKGDVSSLPTLLEQIQGVEVVVHTAGLIGPEAQRRPYVGFVVNVAGTVNVAEAVRLAGARRLVYASTHGVYDFGASAGPMTESSPTETRAVYGASKLSAEHMLQAYSGAYKLDVIVLRFSNIFGRGLYAAGSRGGEAFNELITKAVKGETARVLSPLAGRGEWLYAKDAARALGAAVEREEIGGFTLANVGSGHLIDPEDVIAAIRKELPNAQFTPDGPPSRERQQPFDLSTAAHVLGWEPAYTLESAIADYIAEVRAHAR